MGTGRRTTEMAGRAGVGLRCSLLHDGSRRADAPRRRIVGAVLLVAVLVADATTGCGAQARATSAPAPTSPSSSAPSRPATAAGGLIEATLVARPIINPPSTIWRFTYGTRDRTGRPVVASGFAMVPESRPPRGGRPVFAWSHGTTGLGDRCAPSQHIRDNLAPYGYEQLLAGAVIVQPDDEGLGTPGPHTYLDGVAEGRALLDSVRAARQLAGVGPIAGVVLAGQSQGGGAALWAAQVAARYAPELTIRGVLALAPAAELVTIARAVPDSPSRGLVLLAADGLHASYGAAFDPSTFLTPGAVADLARVAGECVDATVARWASVPARRMLRTNPDDVPAIRRILEANSPGATAPGVPILLAQGGEDRQIPLVVSAQLEQRYCHLGATVVRIVAPGADHDGVVDAVQVPAKAWIADRFADRPAPTDCPTRPPTTRS